MTRATAPVLWTWTLSFCWACLFGFTPQQLDAQVVINEVQAANRTTILDEDGESSDWLELYNAGNTPQDLTGYGVSDEGDQPHRWVLPEIALEPREHLLVWCSGKDRTDVSSELITQRDSPIPFLDTLISAEAEWRYLTGAPEDAGPSAEWRQPDFDDGDWEVGRPGFGFGEEGLVTEFLPGIGAVFLRHVFQVSDPSRLANLIFRAHYDDGLVVYLNGERVLDVNYTEEADPTFGSTARRSVERRVPERFDLSDHMELLRPGDNLLAVALLNSSAANSDMRLVPELGNVPRILHTNFRISQLGENLLLSDRRGERVDAVILPPQSEDRSFGRYPDGVRTFFHILFPTPRGTNDSHVSSELIPNELASEPEAGKYTEPVELALSANIPFDGFEIRYTIRGEPPEAMSSLYEGPLQLERNRVIRAAGFLDGRQITRILTRSFFFESRTPALTLPIISVSMRPEDFQFVHNSAGGRGLRYERPAHMEIFDAEGVPQVAAGFGLRLHGGAGRGGDMSTKKAYRAYFRGIYGDKKLRYRLIPDTDVEVFDKLVLRSNFNDAFRTGGGAAFIRDQVIRDLHQDMGALVSHGSWYNLFVNMQYRGIYNVVERMDKKFFASYFPEDGENWDVIKTGNSVLDGSGTEWNQLRNFMLRNDLRDDQVYEEALSMIDVDNFTSYMLLNIWAQNHDWPHNNWYAARPQRADGQWIFLSWDAEFGVGRVPTGFTSDTFQHVLSRTDAPLTIILRALLLNKRYREFFIAELDRHFRESLLPENVLEHIDSQAAIIEPDVPFEVAATGGSVTLWRNNIQTMRNFARNRNPRIQNHILNSSFFTFPRALRVNRARIVLEDEEEEEVQMITVRATEATEVFFNDVPSPRVEFRTSRELSVVVIPFDIRLEGRPAITLVDPERGRSTSENLIEIILVRPIPRIMAPASGSPSGGDLVTIIGESFTEGVRVEFGGVPAPSVVRLADSREVLQVVTPPGRGTVAVSVINTRPGDLPAESQLEFTYDAGGEDWFLRGDTDNNGSVNISDAVTILRYLTGSISEPSCRDTMDGDDSGIINITDAIFLLNYLFRNESQSPRAPFPDCGPDLTADSLACEAPGFCQ